ncbi:hypothetical protein [Salinactinospora qingdaonensis]|uniref:hypothetical protein n=1 Tax=Salinactinospora qingdaonensis TaxID=702744 RepID=UPI0031EBB0A1
MTLRRGFELAPIRFSDDVRRRLTAVDRLREVWASHPTRRPGQQEGEVQRRFFRRHMLELHALSGADPLPEATVRHLVAGGWESAEIDAATRERFRRTEEALLAMAEDCRAGQALTPDYLEYLARRLPAGGEPTSITEGFSDEIAAAATVDTHPIIRAAHLYVACERALMATAQAPPEQAPPWHWLLPWAVASFSLMRANYPPLVMDRRLAGAPHRPDAEEHLGVVVELFIGLQTAAMRGELSWTPTGPGRSAATGALGTTIHRRLLEHMRGCAASLTPVLREIDANARTAVGEGAGPEPPALRARLEAAAERALFLPGPECRWVELTATVAGTTVSLVVAVQDVGTPATGVLAVTADARHGEAGGGHDMLDLASTDCVTIIPADSADERQGDVVAFVDDTVSRTVEQLMA